MPRDRSTGSARAIRDAVSVLSAAGVASARVDAELLAAYVLDVPRSRLVLDQAFRPEQLDRFRALVAARAGRVPLQHLTGTAPFHRIEVAVGPGVFIPRPETELLVEWGLAAVAGIEEPVIVDLCAGSGAISLAVAHELPHASVYAVERDHAALHWLRRNAGDAGDQIRVVAGDATDPATLADLDGTVDLVLCNPPYVPAGTPVPPEVAGHDPAVAVFSGPDGLDTIRGIVRRAAHLLRPGGALGIEHDDSHEAAVPTLLEQAGYGDVADHADLAGRPRFGTGRMVHRDALRLQQDRRA